MKMYQKIEEITSILMLSRIRGLGPVRFKNIYEKFGSFSKFTEVLFESVRSPIYPDFVEVLGKEVWANLIKQRERQENVKDNYQKIALDQLRKAKEVNGHLITFFDEYYPRSLYHTNQSIPIIYAIGNIKLLKGQKACAVVGTRNPCNWSAVETQRVVKKLVEDGYVIVSGLARGIDSIAHTTALDSDGKTIAVVGCGPDVYFPHENKYLQDRIKESGVVISEYPFGSQVTSLSLKKRNKIIVGLSNLVLITETSVKGGTMNSYLAAVEQKKPIKVFLPISDMGGDFSGNLRVYNDRRIKVEKSPTGSEPNLERLKRIKVLLFDLDGTLWDSKDAIVATLCSILKEKEIKFNERELVKKIGSESPYKLLKSFKVSENTFWSNYKKNYEKIHLFSPKTESMLSEIVEAGRKIGVVTALKGKVASELLERFCLDYLVSVMISPSNTRARKPSPVPILKAINSLGVHEKDAIYIGDQDIDILAAKSAGCFSGLAGWNRSLVISEKPDYIFACYEDLLHVQGN